MAIMGAGGARKKQGSSASMLPMNGGPSMSGNFPKRTNRRKGRQELTEETGDERGDYSAVRGAKTSPTGGSLYNG